MPYCQQQHYFGYYQLPLASATQDLFDHLGVGLKRNKHFIEIAGAIWWIGWEHLQGFSQIFHDAKNLSFGLFLNILFYTLLKCNYVSQSSPADGYRDGEEMQDDLEGSFSLDPRDVPSVSPNIPSLPTCQWEYLQAQIYHCSRRANLSSETAQERCHQSKLSSHQQSVNLRSKIF